MTNRDDAWSYAAVGALFVMFASGMYLWREAEHRGDDVTRAQADNVVLSTKLDEQARKLGDQNVEAATVKGRLEAAQESYLSLSSKSDSQSAQINGLRVQLAKVTAELAVVTAEKERLQGEVRRLIFEVASVDKASVDLKNRLKAAQSDLDVVSARDKDLQKKRDDAYAEVQNALKDAWRPRDPSRPVVAVVAADAGAPAVVPASPTPVPPALPTPPPPKP